MSLSVQTHPNRSLAETARRICELRGGKWSGTKGMACCPAHDDRTPSLGVSLGRQAILFHCFAGCDQQSVLAALAREGFEATCALFRFCDHQRSRTDQDAQTLGGSAEDLARCTATACQSGKGIS